MRSEIPEGKWHCPSSFLGTLDWRMSQVSRGFACANHMQSIVAQRWDHGGMEGWSAPALENVLQRALVNLFHSGTRILFANVFGWLVCPQRTNICSGNTIHRIFQVFMCTINLFLFVMCPDFVLFWWLYTKCIWNTLKETPAMPFLATTFRPFKTHEKRMFVCRNNYLGMSRCHLQIMRMTLLSCFYQIGLDTPLPSPSPTSYCFPFAGTQRAANPGCHCRRTSVGQHAGCNLVQKKLVQNHSQISRVPQLYIWTCNISNCKRTDPSIFVAQWFEEAPVPCNGETCHDLYREAVFPQDQDALSIQPRPWAHSPPTEHQGQAKELDHQWPPEHGGSCGTLTKQ